MWEKQVKEYRCKGKSEGCKGIEFYLIELNFNQLPKKQAKKLGEYFKISPSLFI